MVSVMGTYQASNIVGGNPKNKRRSMDFYPTPRECTDALLDFLDLTPRTRVWECACGQGHIVNVLQERGLDVVATDIQSGTDFLTAELPQGVTWIITNPPFNVAEKFIERCAQHQVSFALLLKSQYWHAAKRRDLFFRYTPSVILPLTWRPDFTGQGASLMDMSWNVWANGGHCGSYALYRPLEKPRSNGNEAKQIQGSQG